MHAFCLVRNDYARHVFALGVESISSDALIQLAQLARPASPSYKVGTVRNIVSGSAQMSCGGSRLPRDASMVIPGTEQKRRDWRLRTSASPL